MSFWINCASCGTMTVGEPNGNLHEFEIELEQTGWTLSGERWYCPGCSKWRPVA